MPGTVTNRVAKECWSVLAFTLAVALVGGICVSGHAQSNTQKDVPLAKITNSLPVAKLAIAASRSSKDKYTTGLSSLPAHAQGPISAAFRGERLLLRVDDRAARYPVVIDPWIQQGELTASDGAAQDQFGNSVAISGNTVVVGSPDHTVGSNYGQGAAYVFVESGGTWSQQAELSASDGAAYDAFGLSVAISGSTIMVGSPCHTNSNGQCGQGAVYVFVENGGTWSQQAELTASDGLAGDYFGWSVAVDGNTAVIGAFNKLVLGHSAQGTAYVFAESGGKWTQQAELTASDGIYNDEFGYSVGLNGSTIVIGAPDRTVGSNQAQGVAYVFAGSSGTWTQQAEVTSSDGEAGDFFAQSVAVGGSTAVMGAPCHPRNGFAFCQGGPGAAYVFGESGGTWTQQAELTPSDGALGDEFGISVSFSGSTIVTGASLHTVGSNQGAAYVFGESGGTWSQQAELAASDGGDYFGWSVAIDGSTSVIGAPAHTVGSNPSQGAAYVFGPSVATVSISPTSLSFGNVAVNSTSAPKTVTLKNTGSTTLDVSSITASTNFAVASNACGATLASGKACKVSVTFTPTQLGPLTGTLSFTDNAVGSPQTVALSGTGITDAKLSPASATYAKQKVGTISAAKTFTLTNNQTVALTSIAISTTGDFAVSATTCTTSLTAKGKCTISVTFTPTATGKRTGQLRVSDSASNSPQTSNLTGTGQ